MNVIIIVEVKYQFSLILKIKIIMTGICVRPSFFGHLWRPIQSFHYNPAEQIRPMQLIRAVSYMSLHNNITRSISSSLSVPSANQQLKQVVPNDKDNELLETSLVDKLFDEEISKIYSKNDDETKFNRRSRQRPSKVEVPSKDENLAILVDYMNHFDTYKIYTMLYESGFKEKQSDIIIEVLKRFLVQSLKDIKEEHVRKNDWENEAYLVQAAESELRTEIQTARELQATLMNSDLARIEREYQLLHDDVNDTLSRLKDELQMEVNDQQANTKLEQKTLSNRIKEVDNRITTTLLSTIQSDIEGLRWHLTSRGLIAMVVFVVGMIIAMGKKDPTEPGSNATEDPELTKKSA